MLPACTLSIEDAWGSTSLLVLSLSKPRPHKADHAPGTASSFVTLSSQHDPSKKPLHSGFFPEKLLESPTHRGLWQLAWAKMDWMRDGAVSREMGFWEFLNPPQRKEQFMQILGSRPLATSSAPLLSFSLGFWEGVGLSRKRLRLFSSRFLITGETGAQSR